MKKSIYFYLIISLISSLIFAKKDKSVILVQDPYTIEDINKLEVSFHSGKEKALESLIEIIAQSSRRFKAPFSLVLRGAKNFSIILNSFITALGKVLVELVLGGSEICG